MTQTQVNAKKLKMADFAIRMKLTTLLQLFCLKIKK